MPHIDLQNDLPGMRSLMAYRPETAEPINELAQILLRDEEGLSRADRELIATYVSYRNDCFYCHTSHGAIACIYLNNNQNIVDAVRNDYTTAPVSDKLKTLLNIAGKVQQSGKAVTADDIAQAKEAGATDKDIHDTVLIAAAFCMFNRYVDGLATTVPDDMSSYPLRAKQIAEHGYGNYIYTTPQPVANE
ncbi:MAG TPA: peroxidase-related enzyme [Chitinophagaceae bacterium]|nr:peroxidase-related enzyme [Chitinophagaceae bacterium]